MHGFKLAHFISVNQRHITANAMPCNGIALAEICHCLDVVFFLLGKVLLSFTFEKQSYLLHMKHICISKNGPVDLSHWEPARPQTSLNCSLARVFIARTHKA